MGTPRPPSRGDPVKKKLISFAPDLWLSTATKADWPYFARWHYRSHHLGIVRYVTLLWHGAEPIGICVFSSPPISLRQRNRFFGLSGKWSRTKIRTMNRQLVTLSRVVLHPTYRGAGLAAAFIRRSCESCPWPWIEALAQMGHINPFFEKAGFVRVGVTSSRSKSIEEHSAIYGSGRGQVRLAASGHRPQGGRPAHSPGTKRLVSQETHEKSRYSSPVYYIFDNRHRAEHHTTHDTHDEAC